MSRRRVAEAALVLGAFGLALVLAEVVVRVVAPRPLPSQTQIREYVLRGMYVADERAGYRLAPGFSGRIERAGHVTEFTTNSLGMRGEEPGTKVKPRIAAFGDSFTWGWGVPAGEEWIHWVGRELARRGGPDVQTLNCGVNGYGTDNEAVALERLGPGLQPDLVLLGFFANDYVDNLLGATGIYTVRDGYLFDRFSHEYMREHWLARESHLFRLVSGAWETFRTTRLGGLPSARPARNFTEEDFQRGMELSEKHIRHMNDTCTELGARFAVIWLPSDVYVMSGTRPEDIRLQAELQARIAAAGIPSVDLLPFVSKERQPAGLYLMNDGHFSVRGNRVAGREIARWILENGLLERAPAAP